MTDIHIVKAIQCIQKRFRILMREVCIFGPTSSMSMRDIPLDVFADAPKTVQILRMVYTSTNSIIWENKTLSYFYQV